MIFETSSKHEFIDKQPMIILTAVTNQLHKIRMPKLSKKIHLRKPLSMSLKSFFIQNFNSNRKRFKSNPNIFINVAFINSTKPSFTQNIIGTKTLRYGFEFVERESYNMSIKKSIAVISVDPARRWTRLAQIRSRIG